MAIDTNELRLLVQAATPGPWRIGAMESGRVAIDGVNGSEVTGFIDPEDGHLILAAANPQAILELLDRLEAAEKATDELESLQRYRTAYNEWIDKTEWMQKSLPAKYLGMHRADVLKDMISELFDRLEAAEGDAAHQKALAESALRVAEGWERKCDALRAKIAEMEQQEPVWFIDERGEPKRYHKSKADYCKYGGLDLLYALPGAKGEEK